MSRVKRGVPARQRHKKILKMMKGQFGPRHRLFRRANEAMLKSLFYAAATVSVNSAPCGSHASTRLPAKTVCPTVALSTVCKRPG